MGIDALANLAEHAIDHAALGVKGVPILDTRYVNTTGDTMTGALVITPTADSTAILQVNQADTTNVFNVDTTNARVGIGGDVYLNTANTGLYGNRGDGGMGRLIGSTETAGLMQVGDSQQWYVGISFLPGTSEAMRLSNSGSLMLGTVDASYGKFTIFGAVDNNNIAFVTISGTDTAISIRDSNTATTERWGLKLDGSYNFVLETATATSGLIVKGAASQSADLLQIQNSAGTELVVVDDVGNVGIGTTSPQEALDVRGDIFTDRWLLQDSNTFIGVDVAGSGNLTHSTGSEGYYNTAIGYEAMRDITTGYNNVALGLCTLRENNSGKGNMAIGPYALYNNTNSNNMAIGTSTLFTNTTGDGNVAIGAAALNLNLSGDGNIAIGKNAGHNNSTGSSSIFIGNQAGYYQTASNILLIDNEKRADAATELTNAILYGVMAAAPADQVLRINGEVNMMSGNVGIGTTGPSVALDVNGLVKITTPTGDQTSLYIGGGTTNRITFANTGTAFMGISGVANFVGMYSTGALMLSAGGTNQNITLTPSGTGVVSLGGPSLTVKGLQISSDGGTDNVIKFGEVGVANRWAIGDQAGSGTLQFSQGIVLGTNTRLAITSAGNVGIGVTDPDTKLEIVADTAIKLGDMFLSSGGNWAHISNNTWFNGSDWANNLDDRAGFLIQLGTGVLNMYQTSDGAGAPDFTNRFHIDANGRCGVNVGSPQAQLHVLNSNSAVHGLIVQGAASQSVNLQEWQDSSGDPIAYIDKDQGINYVDDGNGSIGAITVGTDQRTYGIYVLNEKEGTGGETVAGIYGNIKFKGGSQVSYGGLFYARHDTANSNNADLVGGSFIVDSAGNAGTSSKNIGGKFTVNSNISGMIMTNGYAGQFYYGAINAGATMTDGYGVYVKTGSGVGTLTNGYGIYIEDQNEADTLNYAIYTNAGTVHFGDKVQFTQTDGNEYIDSLADGYMDYRATTAHRFGDGTNQLTIAADGELGLEGTARVTKSTWIPFDGLKAPGTKPATYTDHGISGAWQFSDGTDDTIVANIKFPEDMDMSVAPTMCLGWSTNTAVTSETAVWQLEYLYTQAGEDTTAAAQATVTVDSDAVAQSDGLIIAFFPAMETPNASDVCVHIRIKRLGADGDDDLTDTAELHGIALTYTSNKLGTAT